MNNKYAIAKSIDSDQPKQSAWGLTFWPRVNFNVSKDGSTLYLHIYDTLNIAQMTKKMSLTE